MSTNPLAEIRKCAILTERLNNAFGADSIARIGNTWDKVTGVATVTIEFVQAQDTAHNRERAAQIIKGYNPVIDPPKYAKRTKMNNQKKR